MSTQARVVPGLDLVQRLSDARERSDGLFQIVRGDSLYERPIPERHRIIFYIGHLEAFDWNLLSERILSLKPFHLEFDRLFSFGIDPVGDRRHQHRAIIQRGDQRIRRQRRIVAVEPGLEQRRHARLDRLGQPPRHKNFWFWRRQTHPFQRPLRSLA